MRDSQRSKVYKADSSLDCFGRLETVQDIELFVRRLWQSKRFQREFPIAWRHSSPRVGDGRGRRRACGGFSYIKMPTWARTRGIVIHELAHTVHIREKKYWAWMDGPWHGWQFCSVYLRLTMILLGQEAHSKLKAAFKENRVKFRAPRTRVLSPEQRVAMAARLEGARATKAERRAAQQLERLYSLQERVYDLD